MRSAGRQIAAAAALRPGQRRAGLSDRTPPRRRLVRALVLASALPLTLLSFGIGAINWWNGQRTAEMLAEALGTSITEQVRLQLNQLLAAPRQINALNASAIREGRLDPDNFSQMARTFITQMAVFRWATSTTATRPANTSASNGSTVARFGSTSPKRAAD